MKNFILLRMLLCFVTITISQNIFGMRSLDDDFNTKNFNGDEEILREYNELLLQKTLSELYQINETNMPTLCAIINKLAHRLGLTIHDILIKRSYDNAKAKKSFFGKNTLVIGEEIIKMFSAQELEGIIAHELGHIFYNHANKQYVLILKFFAFCIIPALLVNQICISNNTVSSFINSIISLSFFCFAFFILYKATEWEEHYEKEADLLGITLTDYPEEMIVVFKKLLKSGRRPNNNHPPFEKRIKYLTEALNNIKK